MCACGARKMVLLRSSDGVFFEVEEAVAEQSRTIMNIIEDGCADTTIPVENVTSSILIKVLEYCKNHAEKEPMENVAEKMEKLKINEKKPKLLVEEKGLTDAEKKLKALDDEFIDVDTNTLYDLIMAANFLDIKSLLDLACQKLVNMIKGKKPEDIRQILNIKVDFTKEEEEQVQREQQSLAFDNQELISLLY